MALLQHFFLFGWVGLIWEPELVVGGMRKVNLGRSTRVGLIWASCDCYLLGMKSAAAGFDCLVIDRG